MADEELVSYIEKERARGVEEVAIKRALQEAGWNQQEIDGAFAGSASSTGDSVVPEDVSSSEYSYPNSNTEKKQGNRSFAGIVVSIAVILFLGGSAAAATLYFVIDRGEEEGEVRDVEEDEDEEVYDDEDALDEDDGDGEEDAGQDVAEVPQVEDDVSAVQDNGGSAQGTDTIDVQNAKLSDFSNANVTYFRPEHEFDGEGVTCITESVAGIFATTSSTIWEFTGTGFQKTNISQTFDVDDELLCYLRASDKSEYLLTGSGGPKTIFVRDSGGQLQEYGSGHVHTDYLFESNDGSVWAVGAETHKNIQKFEEGTWIRHTREYFSEYGWVNFLGYDRRTDKVFITAKMEIGGADQVWSYTNNDWQRERAFPIDRPFVNLGENYIHTSGFSEMYLMDGSGDNVLDKLQIDEGSSFLKFVYLDTKDRLWIKGSSSFGHTAGLVLVEFPDL